MTLLRRHAVCLEECFVAAAASSLDREGEGEMCVHTSAHSGLSLFEWDSGKGIS